MMMSINVDCDKGKIFTGWMWEEFCFVYYIYYYILAVNS